MLLVLAAAVVGESRGGTVYPYEVIDRGTLGGSRLNIESLTPPGV